MSWQMTATQLATFSLSQPSRPKPMDQPPRNSVMTREDPTTMAAYSPMKNWANFMEEYSVW